MFFGILGAATLALQFVAFLLSRHGSTALAAIGILYGLMALLTSYGLWHRSRLAPRAFPGWCLTIGAFVAAFFDEQPNAADPLLVFPLVLGAGILYFAWRHISRICARAPYQGNGADRPPPRAAPSSPAGRPSGPG